MFAVSAESKKLIDAIRDQTEGVPNHLVFVIDIVSVRFGGYFTPEIKAEFQRYPNLQLLTLNDCGIKSLENFPNLQTLIRLDLVFNQITGDHLNAIVGSRHLQTLMFGANKIQKIEDLKPLTVLKQLLQIDLINNPVSHLPDFRDIIFKMFPSVTILDTLDKAGKDAYNTSSMVQTVARIPENLFDKGPQQPIPAFMPRIEPIRAPIKVAKAPRVRKQQRPAKIAKAKSAKGGKDPIVRSSRSVSSQSGLLFPVGRIKRKLKQALPGVRVGRKSAIYMAGILQYLSAELLQIAGNETKKQKKHRITPQSIKRCLKSDEQLNNLLKNVTIGLHNE